jgi:hypothetical protein
MDLLPITTRSGIDSEPHAAAVCCQLIFVVIFT